MFEADKLGLSKEGNRITVQISSSGYQREQLELIKEYCPVEIKQQDGTLYLDYTIPEFFTTVKDTLGFLRIAGASDIHIVNRSQRKSISNRAPNKICFKASRFYLL